eukprot:COSAG02_NODE_4_length_69935_cov_46.806590_54_plen_173_part_00
MRWWCKRVCERDEDPSLLFIQHHNGNRLSTIYTYAQSVLPACWYICSHLCSRFHVDTACAIVHRFNVRGILSHDHRALQLERSCQFRVVAGENEVMWQNREFLHLGSVGDSILVKRTHTTALDMSSSLQHPSTVALNTATTSHLRVVRCNRFSQMRDPRRVHSSLRRSCAGR